MFQGCLPHHHYYCSRPIIQKHPISLRCRLTRKSTGCLCLHLRNPLLSFVDYATLAHSHSRCAVFHTRQNSSRDLLYHCLLHPHRLRALSTQCTCARHLHATRALACLPLGYRSDNASGHHPLRRPHLRAWRGRWRVERLDQAARGIRVSE
jgi:hypothetical protein